MCPASELLPKPTSSARMFAPRALAWASDSMTNIADPSARTKPSRSTSNGRLALVGSSERVESALIVMKEPTHRGVTAASAPPTIMTSAVPLRIQCIPSPMAWPEGLLPAGAEGLDTDLKIEALVGLLEAHSERVIPLLRDIALDTKNPAEARRAVFALAQSSRPEARNTVVEAARRGPNMVRIAAIREIGRFGEPAFTTTLVGIARGDNDAAVRDTAIVTLGRTGARVPLRTLYSQVPPAARFTVLSALSTAKGDDELIRIATSERDPRLRLRARQQLRLLGTPKAVKYLEDNP